MRWLTDGHDVDIVRVAELVDKDGHRRRGSVVRIVRLRRADQQPERDEHGEQSK